MTQRNLGNWSAQKEKAAMLRAQGDSMAKVARAVGVHVNTITRWVEDQAFQNRVEEHLAVLTAEITREGIANRQNRLREYADLYDRMRNLMLARGESLARERDAPGGQTGLLVQQEKMLGQGPAAQLVTEYEYDSALMRDMLGVLKQTAQETGEWTEKSERKQEVSGPGGGDVTVKVDYRDQLLKEVDAVARKLSANGLALPEPETVEGVWRETADDHRNGRAA